MYCLKNPAVDLHNHFWASRENHELEEVLWSMDRAGIDICALTDDKDDRYHRIIDKALNTSKRKIEAYRTCTVVDGKKVIMRGEEVYTPQGSVVLAGWKRVLWSSGFYGLEDTMMRGLASEAFVLIPHLCLRFGGMGEEAEKVWRYADAVEINPFCSPRNNKRAERFASSHGIPVLASSDARDPRETGRGYFRIDGDFVFDAENIVQRLKEAVKRGVKNHIRPANWFEVFRYLVKSEFG